MYELYDASRDRKEEGQLMLHEGVIGYNGEHYILIGRQEEMEEQVLDAETDEKYECQLSTGLPSLEHLQELKKQGQPADVLRQVANQLQAELPPKMSQIALQVRRIKGKGSFQTLV